MCTLHTRVIMQQTEQLKYVTASAIATMRRNKNDQHDINRKIQAGAATVRSHLR